MNPKEQMRQWHKGGDAATERALVSRGSLISSLQDDGEILKGVREGHDIIIRVF